MKPRLEIGEILRGYEVDLTKYSHHQRRVLWALRDCRTAALGGHIDACDACGNIKISYNSCRNRHCPKCQGVEKEMWMLAREEEMLPVTYFHVVFTMPHELNDLCRYNAEVMYDLLFESAKTTLQQFGADNRWLGAQLGITMVLHTWGQNLSLHPHVHCIVPNGGLKKDGTWQYPRRGNEKFLFPVAAMQSVYKALFMKTLHQKIESKALNLPPDFGQNKAAYKAWKNSLYEKKWVIYAKRPFGGPKQVIEYLGRYTHKVAISNHRLKGFDKDKGIVRFEYKDYKTGGDKKEMDLTVAEFIRRFAQHILPPKFRRIRHYGFLSNAAKGKSLERARKSLNMKAQIKRDRVARKEEALRRMLGEKPNRCRCCQEGAMIRMGMIPPNSRARSPPTERGIILSEGMNRVVWLS